MNFELFYEAMGSEPAEKKPYELPRTLVLVIYYRLRRGNRRDLGRARNKIKGFVKEGKHVSRS